MSGIWRRIRGTSSPGEGDELTCREIVELVTEYLEGGLSPEERRLFEEHLDVCSGCTNYLDQMRETILVVGRVEVDDLSEETKDDLLAAFRNWKGG